jgi:pimeloyl-ACP methyl ester carboxylesterase
VRCPLLCLFTSLAIASIALADGPADNDPGKVKRIPPPGITIPDTDRASLEEGVAALGREIDNLRDALKDKPDLLEMLPDILVFYKSVHDALKYNEFYDLRQVAVAKKHLQLGMERAKSLRGGKAPWNTATGLVVRGYVSKIDGSVQPYGFVVPPTYDATSKAKHRLDFWCHGRGETLTELAFIQDRLTSMGKFTPPNTFVLHLYGRYCCANKFAGEVDLFEAYDNVRKHYPIDEDRLVIRGFSMGGAACWQFAVHYPGVFCAAAPGAGFVETPEFLKVFQNEEFKPAWYVQKLWNWYDCPGYVVNLFNLPTVAYSGEKDRQKQAADVMAKAFEKEGMTLTHIIGPNMGHDYEANAKKEVARLVDELAAKGRDPAPKHVKFATYTLRYNRSHWIVVERLQQHWEQARVDAELTDSGVKATTTNVAALTFEFAQGRCPLAANSNPKVQIDGTGIDAAPVGNDRSWSAHFRKGKNGWTRVDSVEIDQFEKRPGLQGPIDDAFTDRFIMVAPTGQAANEPVGKWSEREMQHAIEHWRRQFRGEAIVKKDVEVTDADMASSNLILWGDPSSNKLLSRIGNKLPIPWNGKQLQVGNEQFDPARHVLAMIFPNPENPKRYVVLNSGFTFREYDYLNNARQAPKLPDWTVIDVTVAPTSQRPGGIASAGFFDESWRVKTK